MVLTSSIGWVGSTAQISFLTAVTIAG